MTNFDYITFHMVSPQILIAIDHVSNYEKIGIMRYRIKNRVKQNLTHNLVDGLKSFSR